MFRIDDPTAAASVPTPGALGTQGYFTGGNSSTGVPATVVSADWLNAVQEEMAGVMLAAGLTLSKTDRTQLRTALNAGWGMAKSLANPGYATLPGGLILQWGMANSASLSSGTVTFPIAFPNACLFREAKNTDEGSTTAIADLIEVVAYDALSVTQLKWQSTNINTGVLAAPGNFSWFAIGY